MTPTLSRRIKTWYRSKSLGFRLSFLSGLFTFLLLLTVLAIVIPYFYVTIHNTQSSLITLIDETQLETYQFMWNSTVSHLHSSMQYFSNLTDRYFAERIAELTYLANLGEIRSFNWTQAKPLLVQAVNTFHEYDKLFLMLANGSYYTTLDDFIVGKNLLDRPYVQVALSTNTTVVSEPLLSKSTGLPQVVIAAPILNASGTPVGILGGTVVLSHLTSVLIDSSYDLLFNVSFSLISRTGLIAAFSNTPSLALQNASTLFDEDILNLYLAARAGDSGWKNVTEPHQTSLVFYNPLPSTKLENQSYVIFFNTTHEEFLIHYSHIKQKNEELQSTFYEVAPRVRFMSLFLIFLTALLSFLVTIFVIHQVSSATSKQLRELGETTQQIAKGNLNIKLALDPAAIPELRLLQQNFSVMVSTLKSVLGDMKSSAQAVSSTARELSQIASVLKSASESTNTSVQTYSEGVGKQVTLSSDAKKTVQAAVNEIKNLISEIEGTTSILRDIAAQTKVLALNASIEAARVGPAGQGFRVVAHNVKSLAEDSRQHAKEVNTIIKETSDRIAAQLGEIEQFVTSMVEVAEEFMASTEEIAALVEEQSLSIQEVFSLAAKLARLANDLNQIVLKFNVSTSAQPKQ